MLGTPNEEVEASCSQVLNALSLEGFSRKDKHILDTHCNFNHEQHDAPRAVSVSQSNCHLGCLKAFSSKAALHSTASAACPS